jgi:FtsH-binding integral membrane protein
MQFDSTIPQVDPFEALLRNSDLPKGVQAHISRVYQTLLVMIATAALGTVVQLKYQIGGFLTFVCVFASILWLCFTPYRADSSNEKKRTLIACLVSFFVGVSLGPGLGMVYEAHGDGLIATAFIATAAVFAGFSAASLYSNKRFLMYSASVIAAASTSLFVVSISSWFYRTPAMESAMIFLGLVLFSGYIVYDTQIMILQAERGYKDVPMHALQLFLDFVNLFVRILKLLQQKKKKRDD